MRRLFLCLWTALFFPAAAMAEPAPFDLAGPSLQVTVTRGGATLPISQVPNLAAGDRLTIKAKLPDDQSARYLLVAAFLRGATNPPPKQWIFGAETWKRKAKDNMLAITVPDGARQVILFLAPETGGDFGTLVDAVRGRPGEFVRASQDLNQASLDRSRLDAFLTGIRAQDAAQPERLEDVSPILARSLAMKFNADCLSKAPDDQATCLTQDREALVLNDVHSASITEALTGAPADLALQLSATPQGGMGYYSPYIGAVRDLARILGAFHTADYQYIPALAIHRDDSISLLLNAAPSFRKPQSVLVTALPAIEPPHPPPLRRTADNALLCAARPDLVLPVEGAPLVYSTRYAHDMALRLRTKDGRTIDLPVSARADRGGYVVDGPGIPPSDIGEGGEAVLHGYWGFQPFEGPRFLVQNDDGQSWRIAADPGPLVPDRGNSLELKGKAAACVQDVRLRLASGKERPADWKATAADALVVQLPPAAGSDATAVLVRPYGASSPAVVALQDIGLRRPSATLLARTVQPPPSTPISIRLAEDDQLSQDARLTFSIKAQEGTRFSGQDVVEVGTADGAPAARLTAADGLRLENAEVAQAALVPGQALGASAFGPLRFRVVQNGVAGDWQPLATLVRLPALQALECGDPQAACTLSGTGLFLIEAVSGDRAFDQAVTVPGGFTGSALQVPRPVDGQLYVKFRDDPRSVGTIHFPM